MKASAAFALVALNVFAADETVFIEEEDGGVENSFVYKVPSEASWSDILSMHKESLAKAIPNNFVNNVKSSPQINNLPPAVKNAVDANIPKQLFERSEEPKVSIKDTKKESTESEVKPDESKVEVKAEENKSENTKPEAKEGEKEKKTKEGDMEKKAKEDKKKEEGDKKEGDKKEAGKKKETEKPLQRPSSAMRFAVPFVAMPIIALVLF